MAKSETEDKEEAEMKPDGLEIASIGALYAGPWDKKYWSCSRGKDRHPYPIGYQAIRAHNGIIYKMEIHEGSKGPLFAISSADGDYCSGQTPDITWEKFQKKGCIRMNILHGKRFSCKIDGVEFFGFKNPFVQRLLRELVANVNGANDLNSLSSNLCSGTSSGKDQMSVDHECPDECTNRDLLTFIKRTQVTRKRSRRRETSNSEQANGDSFKRPRNQCPVKNFEASNCVIFNNSNEFKEGTMISLQKDKVEEAVPDQDVKHLCFSECSKDVVVDENKTSEEQPPDRSHINITEEVDLTMRADTTGSPFTKHCPESADVYGHPLYAPDSLDIVQDTSDSTPVVMNKNNDCQEDEFAAADLFISEESVTVTRPEGEIDSLDKKNSEKNDFESVGEEMAKSMMTFLLPQAIPLLQKASKPKKNILTPMETVPFEVESEGERSRSEELVNVPTLGTDNYRDNKEDLHIQNGATHLTANVELAQSIVLDSLDQNQCTHDAVQALTIKETSSVDSQRQLVSVYLSNESLVSHDETPTHNGVDKKEIDITLSEGNHDDNIKVPGNFQGCISSSRKIFCEETDSGKEVDENLVGCEIYFEEKNLETAPGHGEGVIHELSCSTRSSVRASSALNENDSAKPPHGKAVARVEGAETKVPLSKVTSKVYNRKKVTNATHSTGKYNQSLSKSTLEKTLGDSFAPKCSVSTEPLHSSDVYHVNFLPDGQPKEDLVPTETKLGSKINGLQSKNVTTRSQDILDNKCSILSHDQESMCFYKDDDSPGFLYASTLLAEKLEGYMDEEVAKRKNISEENRYADSHQNEPTLNVAKLGIHSDQNPHCHVECYQELGRMFLLGCYSLPMPVLSLWLSQNSNLISICVLCGYLAEKNTTLLTYNVDISEATVGYPCFVGHTSVTLPSINDYLGREIALERSGFQLTPNGNSLVMLDAIRTPYCREGKSNCSCFTCTSHSIEENAVKVVQVKLGYVSIVAKYKAVDHLHSILVCKPNHLVAVGESGRMHVWVMNSTWSVQNESYILPSNEYKSPGIVELKKIPKFADLVVGHNGFGEFTIWDISRRSSMSKFSSSRTSVSEFFPVCLFSWKRKGSGFNYDADENVNDMMVSANKIFLENAEKHRLIGEDTAICLFVLPASDSGLNYDSIDGGWKLALLTNNMVSFGTTFDSSACAVGVLNGHGIIGTRDGLVYMWELSSGSKMGTLLHFKGTSVTCIGADDMESSAVAIAGNNRVLIYLQRQ